VRLRRRLVWAITVVTFFTLGGAFAIIFYLVDADQERQLDDALSGEAREEAREAAQIGGDRLAISDGPGPSGGDIGPLTKYGAIYGPDGALLAATDTFHGRPPPFTQVEHPTARCFDAWFGSEHLRAVLVPVPQHPGTLLLLAAPRLDLDHDARFLRRAMLLVLLVAVVWEALVAGWVVRRFTRGHEAVATVARQVASGDLTARVSPQASAPEAAQLAEDVNRMIDRLSALLSSQKEFIAYAAHELRSPLTTLYGELSLALRRPRDAPAYRASIEEALDSAARLKALAEDLLVLARAGAEVDATPDEVVPRALLEEVRRAATRLGDDRGVTLEIRGESRTVRGRTRDLERLLRNLVENAIRHSPAGGKVEIVVGDDGDAVTVTIADQGPGVPERDRARIFEPFYRGPLAEGDDLSGFGLGLTIARKIARAQGAISSWSRIARAAPSSWCASPR
jgi:two-component system OmpR family sensor kinase